MKRLMNHRPMSLGLHFFSAPNGSGNFRKVNRKKLEIAQNSLIRPKLEEESEFA